MKFLALLLQEKDALGVRLRKIRSSHPQVFYRETIMKKFAKTHMKTPASTSFILTKEKRTPSQLPSSEFCKKK